MCTISGYSCLVYMHCMCTKHCWNKIELELELELAFKGSGFFMGRQNYFETRWLRDRSTPPVQEVKRSNLVWGVSVSRQFLVQVQAKTVLVRHRYKTLILEIIILPSNAYNCQSLEFDCVSSYSYSSSV